MTTTLALCHAACTRQPNLRRYEDLIQDTYKCRRMVPPRHRRNAEVAIQTSTPWQGLLTISSCCKLHRSRDHSTYFAQSNATPIVSRYAHLNGPFDYNKMPLAPMGCNAQVHEKTDSRGTWAFHCRWVVRQYFPEHYQDDAAISSPPTVTRHSTLSPQNITTAPQR
eukprot:CCRYP_013738-RA/>CCRYP_013738-RA protein AED:0.44 eAED:0.45 QI:0/0/0/1/0/0/2/0/165